MYRSTLLATLLDALAHRPHSVLLVVAAAVLPFAAAATSLRPDTDLAPGGRGVRLLLAQVWEP